MTTTEHQAAAQEVARKIQDKLLPDVWGMTDDFADIILPYLMEAEKRGLNRAEAAIGKFLICEFDPRLSPLPDEQINLVRRIRDAVRALSDSEAPND